MKKLLLISWACLPCLMANAEPPAEPGRRAAPLSLIVQLTDGSRLRGTAAEMILPVVTAYGKVELAAAQIATMESSGHGGAWKIRMRNGDGFQGALEVGAMEMRTLMGGIRVPFDKVSRVLALTEPFYHLRGSPGASEMIARLKKALVLYYPFDWPSPRVEDLSGKGNHGTLHGVKWTADGKLGGAYDFPQTGAHVRAKHAAAIDFTEEEDFTISLWALPKEVSARGQQLIYKYSSENRSGYLVAFGGSRSPHRLVVAIYSNGDTAEPGCDAPDVVNKWTHIVGVRKRGSFVRLYVNGRLAREVPDSLGSIANSSELRIGGSKYKTSQNFAGPIDEVMVFNRALSAKEVQLLSKSP